MIISCFKKQLTDKEGWQLPKESEYKIVIFTIIQRQS